MYCEKIMNPIKRYLKFMRLLSDIIEWDVINWGRAVCFWEKDIPDSLEGKKVLDVGGRGGGLSLFFALKGANVICSNVRPDGFEKAKMLHKKYGLSHKINYKIIDVTEMSFEEEFDIVTFKSVLGGVGYNNHYDRQEIMMRNIYKALKPGGKLYFAENLIASPLHQKLRKAFTAWGDSWRYISIKEAKNLTKDFTSFHYWTGGVLGTLGRKKILSYFLGILDYLFDRFCGKNAKYIISAICQK